eukprot:SAG25_NODE_342_length_9432_cov_2.769305_6_plen_50_part_00
MFEYNIIGLSLALASAVYGNKLLWSGESQFYGILVTRLNTHDDRGGGMA